ncbi:hypothetical protein F0Q34_14045 [Pseudoroseomonas oryzae]|uniref:Uncharacterized protein n=1 Tax=Teichococcus oryzae TaxID=1608942 RepID=A0A5B2TD68_9PROT|nr:hypothetical protein F0Q34_14045 [Pseudoroseomonas oryzae]
MLVADPIEDVLDVPGILLERDELDAVVDQHGVAAVGNGLDEVAQDVRRLHLFSALDETDGGELADAVDSGEKAQFVLLDAALGQVNVEVADRIGDEALLGRLAASHLGQAADSVSL